MKIQRKAYKTLLAWKNKKQRMPLVLMGARQVGKTFLITQFGENEYRKVHLFNFQEELELHQIFNNNLDPRFLLDELAIIRREDINIDTDLVFFDEVQECDRAVTALKFFQEKLPQLNLIAAGSLLGVKLGSSPFPVGKVEFQHLYPISFSEFLEASSDKIACRLFNETSRLNSAHNILWDFTRQYFFVGGMPRCVVSWFSNQSINARISEVRKIQKDLLAGYENDFAKHSGKVNALHISTLLNNIPQQLCKVMDGSVKRFKFKDVLPGKRTYAHLSGPISWLDNAKLVYKVFPIECKPQIPLKAFHKENFFKLFLFDVGMLAAILDLTYHDLRDQAYGITKGFFAENFVVCELKANGYETLFSWSQSKSEIEFLYVSPESDIIPIEVKSGKRTKAKSLKSYIDRYAPRKTIKFVGKVGGTDPKNIVLPLYYSGKLKTIILR